MTMDTDADRRHMRSALELAAGGTGWVSPNPLVGCVIVNNGEVVGRGYHQRFGGPHAEVNALREAENRAKGAVLYVTLEPCCHTGKTPPCVDAILQARLGRVVAAMRDPNPRVDGGGLARLENAGIEVAVGVCETEARRLNEAFVKHITTRPAVRHQQERHHPGRQNCHPQRRLALDNRRGGARRRTPIAACQRCDSGGHRHRGTGRSAAHHAPLSPPSLWEGVRGRAAARRQPVAHRGRQHPAAFSRRAGGGRGGRAAYVDRHHRAGRSRKSEDLGRRAAWR